MTQHMSDMFFETAILALAQKGKYLNDDEKEELGKYVSNAEKLIIQKNVDAFKFNNDFRSRILEVATASLSIIEILKKLCPIDPICD